MGDSNCRGNDSDCRWKHSDCQRAPQVADGGTQVTNGRVKLPKEGSGCRWEGQTADGRLKSGSSEKRDCPKKRRESHPELSSESQ